MPSQSKPDRIKEAAEEIVKLCGEATNLIDLMSLAIKRRKHPRTGVISDSYSVRNQLLIYLRGYSEARGCKAWSDAGRRIQKGQRAAYILRPRIIWVDVSEKESQAKKPNAK